MSEKIYQDIKIERLPKSRVKITGEVTTEAFEKARKNALSEILQTAEIPGFRVGKAPEAMVVKHVGEMKILERAAGSAIEHAYSHILDEKSDPKTAGTDSFRPIGHPHITITKIAAGNPLGFVIETDVMPEISLDNYKKLAKEAAASIAEAKDTVEEKEIDTVIEDLRKHLAIEAASVETADATNTTDATEKTEGNKPEKILPEVNDEFVKKFGNFANVAEFREHAKKNLLDHKKNEVKEKRRGAIADKLLTEAKFEVPEIFVESELETMLNQFRGDIERVGLAFADYLKSIKKTEEEIRNEWRDGALRRARLELILKHIARSEKIAPDEEKVKKEIEHIMSHHKTADRFSVRMFIENQMKNKMVFELLEKEAGE